MAMIILLFGTFLVNDPSYFLYMKDGQLLEVKAMPNFEGRFCYFTLLNGEKSMMPSESIDFDKTEIYNKELADKKKAELEVQAQSEKVAQEIAEAASVEKKEPRKIELKGTWELEKYKDVGANSSGTVTIVEEKDSNILGQPRVQTWKSEDDIYLAKETISRTRDGYFIDCILKVNRPAGVINAKLKLSVNLDNDQLTTFEQIAEPAEIPYEGEGSIRFVIHTEHLIIGTSYTVEAELQ